MPVSSFTAFCTLFNRYGFIFNKSHRDGRVFHQIIPGVTDQFRRQRHGFVCLRIRKNKVVAVLIAELHLPRRHRHHFHFFRGAEPHVRRFAGLEAADAGLDEGAQVARRAMLCVEDDGDITVVEDRHALA